MDFLIKAAQLILSLSILVVLHEFGHYIPARLFKTRVEKFYLFFNPWFSLFKKKVGETEWGIGWLPLGGYVKIAGMVDESMDKEQLALPAQPWEFRAKPAWQRLIIMLGGVTVNLLLGFFIYIMVVFAYGEEKLNPRFPPTEKMRSLPSVCSVGAKNETLSSSAWALIGVTPRKSPATERAVRNFFIFTPWPSENYIL
jgi:RIP metalloprotease RseP